MDRAAGNPVLRNPDDARTFLLQGLCLQRVLPRTTFKEPLEWALELAAAGQPLPPLCLVADLGHLALGLDAAAHDGREAPAVPGVPNELVRRYEDHVLGKVAADWTFARAGDALRRYHGRDRARGVAFLLDRFRARARVPGVELSPAVLKALLEIPAEEGLGLALESLQCDGLHPVLGELLRALLDGVLRMPPEVLDATDLFHLEHGTALQPPAQRLALDQVLRAARDFEEALPRHRPRPLAGRQEVPTRILDEDTYPVGGFSSLSTRGSIESLLHSQLAFMEKDERPDLFDVKYLRNELLYYSRDENQFLRRRRTFAFALSADLVQARFKDVGIAYQRIVLLLAVIAVIVGKLSDWLSTDALTFVIYFLPPEPPPATARVPEIEEPLQEERNLLQTLFREEIANGTVELRRPASLAEVERELGLRARRSLCHCLAISAGGAGPRPDSTAVTRLEVKGPRPSLAAGDEPASSPEADTAADAWNAALRRLLQRWV